MEYIDIVVNLITSLGFPIVVAGALFWYINKKDRMHTDEINSFRESFSMNTKVLSELKELISTLNGRINHNG